MRRLLVLLVLAAGCGSCTEPTTLPTDESVRLQLVPVFRQSSSTPVLPVDELSVRVLDDEENTLLLESIPVPVGALEVEAALRVDATPGATLVIELALRDGGIDVYSGGPVAVVPTTEPIPIDVAYVGEAECEQTVGSANIGPIGGSPGLVTGRLELGDCYEPGADSFADRWLVDVPRDAGLELAAYPSGQGSEALSLSLETIGGSVVVEGGAEQFGLFVAAGSYVAVVSSASPLAEVPYDLLISEFDRCDAESGMLALGSTRSQALTLIDCPLASGRSADLWGIELGGSTAYRIDLESTSFDAQLVLTDPSVIDPFTGSPIAEDDDRGLGSNALLAGVLPAGSYRLWATSFGSGEVGTYLLSMHALSPGAPTLEVLDVAALGIGGAGGVCGSSQAFRFEFGYEDGDGDLVAPAGVTVRLTGVPSGTVETKGLAWDSFSGLNPYAGYTDLVTCETFGSDTAKLAEFFIEDAAGGASAIYTTTLSSSTGPAGVSGTPPRAAAGSKGKDPHLHIAEPAGGLRD